MLIQLPGGDWVDPRSVVAVIAEVWTREGGGDRHKSRVLVHDARPAPTVIDCESEARAHAVRDEIAAAVNAAIR